MLDRAQWNSTQRSAAISEVVTAASALLRAAGDHVRCEPFCIAFRTFLLYIIVFLQGFYAGKSTYVSAGYRNPVRFFVEWLAIYATGSTSYTSNVKDKNTCDDLGGEQNVYVYTWQADPHTGTYYCYRSSVDVYQVNSPAFRIQ
ncbi:hypothetical protein TELCIR_23785, partial [Teladorsagia circumcincta]